MNRGFLNIIIVIAVVLFLISLSFYLYTTKKQPPEETIGLKINLVGPNEVNSVETYTYKIQIENDSNKVLEAVTLKIAISEGAFFARNPQERDSSIFLSRLDPYKSKEENIDLFFINAGNIKESIRVIVNYKLLGKDYVFAKENIFNILVKNPPLKTQIFTPLKVYSNQQFQINFQITNLTNEKLENVKARIETPFGFILSSSFPKSEELYWEYSSFEPKEVKNISIIGQIQDVKTSGIFAVKLDFKIKDFNFSMPKEIAKINVLENPVAITLKATPANKSIPIGSTLFYEISIKNNSQAILENGYLNVIFSDIFDLNSVKSDGYLSKDSRLLYWNTRNKPELLALRPGDEVNFNIIVDLYDSYPILSGKEKDFTSKIRVEFRTPSIPIEAEAIEKEYVISIEDEKNIIGNIELEHNLTYNNPDLPGEGPFPPEPNKPTILTWQIKVKSIGEDFDDLVIRTKLPLEINVTKKVAGDASPDNLKFDSRTGNFIYTIKKLPANLGYTKKELNLIFQIAIELPAGVETSFIIIPKVEYSAIGSFSKSLIQKSLREITYGYLYFR